MIFDNTKIKQINPEFQAKIPFREGAKEILFWYDEDPDRRVVASLWDLKMEEILKHFDSHS